MYLIFLAFSRSERQTALIFLLFKVCKPSVEKVDRRKEGIEFNFAYEAANPAPPGVTTGVGDRIEATGIGASGEIFFTSTDQVSSRIRSPRIAIFLS